MLTHIGEVACERGHEERCEQVLKLAIKIDPFAVECMKMLSRVYYERSKIIHMQAEYTQAEYTLSVCTAKPQNLHKM